MDEDERNEADLKRPDDDGWGLPVDAIFELAPEELTRVDATCVDATTVEVCCASEWSDCKQIWIVLY